jgi:hypothetical protein
MNRLPNRSTTECEQHLQAFFKVHRSTIPKAVDAYHKKNPQSTIKREMSDRILAFPMEGYEKHYWDILSEIFLLEGNGLQEGIYKRVEEFHEVLEMEPCVVLPYGSEFHLL